jgi:hypothetical protein
MCFSIAVVVQVFTYTFIHYFLLFQDYLRDQMTITEVTMARLYNWDVKKRKEGKKGESTAVEAKA